MELVREVSVAAFGILYSTVMRVFVQEFLKYCGLRLEKLFLSFSLLDLATAFLNPYTPQVTELSFLVANEHK